MNVGRSIMMDSGNQDTRSEVMQRMHFQRRMRDEIPSFTKEERERIIKERKHGKGKNYVKMALNRLGTSNTQSTEATHLEEALTEESTR